MVTKGGGAVDAIGDGAVVAGSTAGQIGVGDAPPQETAITARRPWRGERLIGDGERAYETGPRLSGTPPGFEPVLAVGDVPCIVAMSSWIKSRASGFVLR